ncbi:MAG: hypothetical protein ACRDT2_07900, partial [Natronosporangium sp.]
MDFWDVAKLMWRRWYLTAPMLLLTAFAAGWIVVTVGPEYQATGYVAVVPPNVQRAPEVGQPSQVNPWNEEALAHAASIRLTGRQVADELATAGFAGEWTVEVNGQLPVLAVEVVAPTADQALDTMHELQAVVEEEVAARQAEHELLPGELITTVTYDQAESVDTTASRQRRALVAVVGAGLILTTGVVIAVDALIRWRRRHRPPAAVAPAPARAQAPAPTDAPTLRRYAYRTAPAPEQAARLEPGVGRPNGTAYAH